MSRSEIRLLGHLLHVSAIAYWKTYVSVFVLYPCIQKLWQQLIPQIDLKVQENCKSIEEEHK